MKVNTIGLVSNIFRTESDNSDSRTALKNKNSEKLSVDCNCRYKKPHQRLWSRTILLFHSVTPNKVPRRCLKCRSALSLSFTTVYDGLPFPVCSMWMSEVYRNWRLCDAVGRAKCALMLVASPHMIGYVILSKLGNVKVQSDIAGYTCFLSIY